MNELGKKMAKGAIWTILLRISRRAIGLVSTVILARLLVPADFGLVAMATSIIAALELLGAFSFDVALIHNQNAKREHFDTAWTCNVVFCVCSSLILLLLAAPASRFYGELRLEGVMYALALGTLVQGFANIGLVRFQKELEFGKEFRFVLAKALTGFTVTVSLAFYFRNYWALIAGMLCSNFCGVVLSYCMQSYRPRFSLAAGHDLFRFSKWLLGNNILSFLNTRSSDFIIAKVAGPHSLGVFGVGFEIATLPTTELIAPINRAVFPGYAKMSHDPGGLKQGFLNVLSVISLFALPAGAGIAAIAAPLVSVVLGAKWADSVAIISILAGYGTLTALQSNAGYVFLALGKPKVLTCLIGAQVILRIPLLVLGITYHGVIGAAWALLISEAIRIPFSYLLILRVLGLRLASITKVIWRPVIASCAMVWALRCLQDFWVPSADLTNELIQLAVLIVAGALAYITTVAALWKLSLSPNGAEKYIFAQLRESWASMRMALKGQK